MDEKNNEQKPNTESISVVIHAYLPPMSARARALLAAHRMSIAFETLNESLEEARIKIENLKLPDN